MLALAETALYENSRELPRILWGLELARRAGAGPQTAADLARLITTYAGVLMHNTNVARLFRYSRESGEYSNLWETHSLGRNRAYVLSRTGELAVKALFLK